MIKVLGRRNSSSVQLVMWTIAELGLKYDREDYGHGHASTRTGDYLKMNPMGRVPVLIDGDLCLFESAAILRYLAARYGSDEFWPADPARRAPLDTWAEWGKGTFTEAVLEVFVYDVRLSPDTRDPAILRDATARLIPLAAMLDQRIGDGPWLDGERFTFADIACGHILHRYHSLNWSRPALANLGQYYDRLQTRPAYRDHAMVSYEDLRGSY
ncbi:glutathione S-transferase family protein [Loktanella sp. IMCC34160]|uniref:glutathione S-transferase family protein n=1 Tax=Loktanella sp. IMCC34160 TaxID=2510646 RepID=UPI00101D60E3|nr:glutathione S-transferase family protein [Loktanella sp. IMCC34160]RYG93003.1 glutathione S-transferase family protein [Loktanella sp. IMCC34160]